MWCHKTYRHIAFGGSSHRDRRAVNSYHSFACCFYLVQWSNQVKSNCISRAGTKPFSSSCFFVLTGAAASLLLPSPLMLRTVGHMFADRNDKSTATNPEYSLPLSAQRQPEEARICKVALGLPPYQRRVAESCAQTGTPPHGS